MSSSALKTYSRVKHRRFFSIKRRYSNESNESSWSSGGESSDSGDQTDKSRSDMYDTRKYSHGLPGNDVQPPFDTPKIPTGIFRCTCGEVIGPQAGKCAYYRNPEYYSFHHMSFFDLHLVMAPLRKPQIKSGRKPTII